jgi:hypothetical protein
MGGTWVSHVHGRLFAEMQRYGLKDSVSMTRTEGGGAAYFTIDTGSFRAKSRTVGESLTSLQVPVRADFR